MPIEITGDGCMGYLKKWAKFRYNDRWFKISKNILSYYTDELAEDYLGRLHIPQVTVVNDKDESKFIVTDNKNETYHLIANCADEKKSWISELVKRGANLDSPNSPTSSVKSKISVDEALQENFSGYLEKWATVRYNTRWFELCDQYISYYNNKTDNVFRGRMLLKGTIIVKDGLEDDDEDIRFLLTDGNDKYYLKASNSEEKSSWVSKLQDRGVRSESVEQFNDTEYYGELVPTLSFPNNFDIQELEEREETRKKHLKYIETIVATVVENGLQVGKNLMPFGGLAVTAVGYAITSARKIFDVFANVSIQDLTNKLKGNNQKEFFEHSLKQMQAEMSATHKRYENLFTNSFSLEEQKAEIPVAVQSFEKLLALFQMEECLFLSNAFLMSPFLKEFAVLFLAFSKLAVVLHPKYKKELCNQLEILAKCLESYKAIVVKERLSAISHSGNSLRKQALSVGKIIAVIPELVYKVAKGEDEMRMAVPMDKVKDTLYPTPSGVTSRNAYPRDLQCFEGKSFYEDYKTKIMELYTSYFDESIEDILKFTSNSC